MFILKRSSQLVSALNANSGCREVAYLLRYHQQHKTAGKEQKVSQLPRSASRFWEDVAKGNIHIPVSAFQTNTWILPQSSGLGKGTAPHFCIWLQ